MRNHSLTTRLFCSLITLTCVASLSSFAAPGKGTLPGAYDGEYLHVINNTSYNVEEIIRWTCDYLEIRNVTICVAPQTRYFEQSGFVIKQDDIYYIYIKENLASVHLIMVHELIHVKQYETGELRISNGRLVNFKGANINLKKIPYDLRSYEVEAHNLDSKILQRYYSQRKQWLAAAKLKNNKKDDDEAHYLNNNEEILTSTLPAASRCSAWK